MILGTIIEEMAGKGRSEFVNHTVMLDLDTSGDLCALAHELGVPVSRLLAELVAFGLPLAQREWRALNGRPGERAKPANNPPAVLSDRLTSL